MKKRISYILAAGLVAWSSFISVASADDLDYASEGTLSIDEGSASDESEISEGLTSNFNDEKITIKVLDSLTSTDTYLVNLRWTSMSFVFVPTSRVWNATDLKWESKDTGGSWYKADEAPTSAEDIESESSSIIEPEIGISVQNCSSRKLEVSFTAGATPIDLDSSGEVEVLNADNEETGITLSATGPSEIDPPAQASFSVGEEEDYADADDSEPDPQEYTIHLGGIPKPDEGTDTLEIPLTIVFKPAGDGE